MDKALLSKIEHHVTEQLKTAVEDIIASVFEDVLEVSDYDTHYDVAYDALDTYGGDVEELAENVAQNVLEGFANHLQQVQTVVAERFAHEVLPYVKAAHEQDGILDRPARREAWCNFIDSLNKNNEISDYEADNIDFDVESL
tara:strand:+ start:455 stop:880 length:426 start_codon:yes stop_codon:yes gene_type:complete